jgi:integrase
VYLTNRKGVWYAVGKIHGRLYRESTGFRGKRGSEGYKLAERRKAEIENEIRADSYGWLPEPVPTVAEYWSQVYRPTYTVTKRAPGMDDRVMAHAEPILGPFRLDAVTTSDCEAYLNLRRQQPCANPQRKTVKLVAEGTVQRERSFLATLFRRAVDDGIIAKNPWKAVKAAGYDVRDRVVTGDEQRELLSRLSPRFQRFVVFLIGTGIRLEECRGIDPTTDIDLKARRMRVTGKFGKTREIPIPAALVPVIKKQLKADKGLWTQNPQRLRAVLARACRAVEPSAFGTRPQWQRKARTAIPLVSPHALRHTFGHRWLKGGGDIYALSRILGHASVAVTERHYALLLTEDLRVKMDAVDLGLPKRARRVITKVLDSKQRIA